MQYKESSVLIPIAKCFCRESTLKDNIRCSVIALSVDTCKAIFPSGTIAPAEPLPALPEILGEVEYLDSSFFRVPNPF